MKTITILIIEDEAVISNVLATILTKKQYLTVQASNGKQALTLAPSHNPDVILLDLGLPDMDGIEVLKKLREWSTIPILVVSARQLEEEKVQALDAGADDYITKPFGNSELLARIRSALRRAALDQGVPPEGFQIQDLLIDFHKRIVTLGEERIHLTPIEFKIINLLAQHAGRVLTHEFIIKEIWGPYASDAQVLRVNMANIRRKIEKNPADPEYILTEVGVGYRMIDTE